ncbi:uroporphyrinogen-III synthase [Lysinibacillus yapensis]|uniref:Uroporphyrinogen-III synthase n=1 Tax=Ureibacillus yapensis TaxID=2304605 RepID=A0A396S4C8_9BACL|nr:uroporphyrinogen-III synthase [Lysinibacillus yapensis]RHW33373.1 uroporphyrinogen-III synthase [Lysinibacillus yapensis]
MPKPLEGKTVVVTGSSKTSAVLSRIEQLGGEAFFLPLIETREIIEEHDFEKLKQAFAFDWLIFTSQNAVEAFFEKIKRHRVNPARFIGKIAAVGSKTAKLLENNGFHVSFVPSIFSADVFVKEFPKVADNSPECLFLRGGKAKDTIKKGLPFRVAEWTVYDTYTKPSNIEPLTELIKVKERPIIIFASPSAVEMFAENIAPVVGWQKPQFASIGHITTAKLEHYGASVTYQPSRYTMLAVIEEIRLREENNHDRT